MGLTLRLSLVTDAKSLCDDIRKEDNEEWVAGGDGTPPLMSLQASIRFNAGDCWSVIDERGECLAVWGCNPSPHYIGVGEAWMICANGAVTRLHAMHQFFKIGIKRMHDEYPILHAWALSTNRLHHKWMLRMGFKSSGTSSPRAFGTSFLLFTRTETSKVHVLPRSRGRSNRGAHSS